MDCIWSMCPTRRYTAGRDSDGAFNGVIDIRTATVGHWPVADSPVVEPEPADAFEGA